MYIAPVELNLIELIYLRGFQPLFYIHFIVIYLTMDFKSIWRYIAFFFHSILFLLLIYIFLQSE